MSAPFSSRSPASKDAAVSRTPTSAFGFRFHQAGRSNVYFRREPDLTCDPNQAWVPFDTSDIKFENYTLDNMPYGLDTASTQEEIGDEADAPSPKRRKTDSAVQSSAPKVPSFSLGFRVDKPVKADVCDDIWRTILKESHPSVLLNCRYLNRRFHVLLQEQSIWRASRIKLHGEDMPGPPGEMTEQRYAQLLYGQGCDFQRSKCGSSVTKKVYWPFLLRMCDACFRRKTEKDKVLRASAFREMGDNGLCELIPAGMTSSGKYVRTRRPNHRAWEGLVRAVYLRSHLEAISSEYREKKRAGIPTVQIDAWKEEKRAKARAFMTQCRRIEDFQRVIADSQPRHRETRAEYFIAQAANLTPPLDKDVMGKMMAFKMSLDSNHEPTPRSWGDLKKKLLPHRAAAERLLELEQQNERYCRDRHASPAILNYRLLYNVKTSSSQPLPEQVLVTNLGQQQLNRWQDRKVADADLVLLVLKGVYEAYQRLPVTDRPRGTNTDLSQGVYRLTLDDARTVIRRVIKPEVQGWNNNVRARRALDEFKCVGCVRKDCSTRYDFDEIFEHIHEKHATYVTEGEDFHKLYRAFDSALRVDNIYFPWYSVEWPKNLPIAASHHKVSKDRKWLADAEVPYITAAVSDPTPAFLNRKAFNHLGNLPGDFQGNLTYAAAKLRPTRLNSLCQMRLALQYALDRYAVAFGTAKPSLAAFIGCHPKLQAANEEFTLTFSCGLCRQNPDIARSAIHTRPETLPKLKEHFEKTHGGHDWTLSLMDLPSDTQVTSILHDADEQSLKEKRATEEREASLAKNPRKKADPNAMMILRRPEAMAIFDELFPKVGA